MLQCLGLPVSGSGDWDNAARPFHPARLHGLTVTRRALSGVVSSDVKKCVCKGCKSHMAILFPFPVCSAPLSAAAHPFHFVSTGCPLKRHCFSQGGVCCSRADRIKAVASGSSIAWDAQSQGVTFSLGFTRSRSISGMCELPLCGASLGGCCLCCRVTRLFVVSGSRNNVLCVALLSTDQGTADCIALSSLTCCIVAAGGCHESGVCCSIQPEPGVRCNDQSEKMLAHQDRPRNGW